MISDFFAWVTEQITSALADNEFFAGGLMLAVCGMLSGFVYKVVGPLKAFLRRRYTITIEVRDREPFGWTAEWLASKAAERGCRLLSVSEDNAAKPGKVEDELASKAVFVPGRGSHLFWVDRRPVWVSRSLEDATESINGFTFKVDTITLTTPGSDPAVLKKVILSAELAYRTRRNHRLSIWCDDGYGDWDESELQVGRPIDSVILEGDNANTIVADLDEFLATRERYEKVGAPYRRGYLFYGPPGCGKTSLAKAMATESAADLYVLSISSNKLTDEGLMRRLSRVKPGGIVVLEDVDAVFHGRESKGDGVTFSGLLNAIDGVASTEGRILVMTTNHKDKLDFALIRPGRADVHLRLGPADADMAARLFMRFFPDDWGTAQRFALFAAGATPAAIQTHLFKHWDDAEGAINAWQDITPTKVQVTA